MNSPLNVIFICCFAVCFCVVQAKNVKNTRSKRTIPGLETTCENVKSFFDMKNITLPVENSKGSICDGQCCDEKAEAQLRKQGQRDFAALLRHNSRSLQGLLSSTSTTLQNHIAQLAQQSENKTLYLFATVYRRMAIHSIGPIQAFYSDIRNYVLVNTTTGEIVHPDLNIKSSASTFFTDLFPLVYLYTLYNTEVTKDFSPEYKSCLKQSASDILPFGTIPEDMSQLVSKSLEASRLLFQALAVGLEVMNATDTLLVNENGRDNAECHDALVKLTYCPRCMGLHKNTKPCRGYCLNVLRGCLTKYVIELDAPWNSYVEAIEKLVNAMKQQNNEAGVNTDDIIGGLENRISEAIMYAMGKGKDIDSKVKKNCGLPKYSDKEDPLLTGTSTLPNGAQSGGKQRYSPSRMAAYLPPPETQLLRFLISISKTKGFYGNLADTLCGDESYAEPNDRRCWNGERIAEYSKTVVDSSLDMQKYNPEVKPSTSLQNGDRRIADLADKLRQVHNLVTASLGLTNSNEIDYMQRDSGSDGSGSGNGSDFDEEEDEYSRGSGSGDGPGHVDGTTGVTRSPNTPQSKDGRKKVNPFNPTYGSIPTTKEGTDNINSSSRKTSSLVVMLLVLFVQTNIGRMY